MLMCLWTEKNLQGFNAFYKKFQFLFNIDINPGYNIIILTMDQIKTFREHVSVCQLILYASLSRKRKTISEYQ